MAVLLCVCVCAGTNPEDIVEKYEKFEMPFMYWDKSETVPLVSSLDMEWLYEASHTCTELDKGRCSQCWQCKEREWGFTENKMVDPGIK